MARIAKRTKRDPRDLTDEEGAAMEPSLAKAEPTGRPRRADLREVLNALRSLVRSGCEWRMLPAHVPAWPTVYRWFRRLARRLVFRTIHDGALMIDRARGGRDPEPSAAAVDGQAVSPRRARQPRLRRSQEDRRPKAPHRGRHRRPPAPGQAHSTGAQAVVEAIRTRWRWVRHLFGDGACDRQQLLDKAVFLGFTLEIIKRTEAAFKVLPRRWVAERTFGRRRVTAVSSATTKPARTCPRP